jgi:uncharacterized membrane protein required for colicin V production
MLAFLTIVVMLLVGYAFFVEGLFTAFLMFCNVIMACLVTFNFWEPVADELESVLRGSFLQGYEDALIMMILFSVTLALLRLLTNQIVDAQVDFPEVVQRGGGALFGLLTGYLVSGFLFVMMQTLPFDENFMSFNPIYEPSTEGMRRYLPPDRVVLAMMHRAGAEAFSNRDDTYFSRNGGSFSLRYARYRRYSERANRDKPLPYYNEFESPPPQPKKLRFP